MVVCLERGADLHMAQLMPLPLTVSCSSKIQIGFTFLVPAHPGSPGQRSVKRVCGDCVCVCHSLKSANLLKVSSVCTRRPHTPKVGSVAVNYSSVRYPDVLLFTVTGKSF